MEFRRIVRLMRRPRRRRKLFLRSAWMLGESIQPSSSYLPSRYVQLTLVSFCRFPTTPEKIFNLMFHDEEFIRALWEKLKFTGEPIVVCLSPITPSLSSSSRKLTSCVCFASYRYQNHPLEGRETVVRIHETSLWFGWSFVSEMLLHGRDHP